MITMAYSNASWVFQLSHNELVIATIVIIQEDPG